MAGEKADVKHFDLKQMENFRDNEVHPVYVKAKQHREDGSGEEGEAHIRPLGQLIKGYTTADNLDQGQQMLRLGFMNTEKLVSGPTLIESVTTAATALDKLLGDQMDLFKEAQGGPHRHHRGGREDQEQEPGRDRRPDAAPDLRRGRHAHQRVHGHGREVARPAHAGGEDDT
ncbi:hypothetical protein SGRI78S_06635 [Streptomyces griseus subsp. griseus]